MLHTLYRNLMALCDDEAFFFVDQVHKGATYRIFNYRLASYSQFLLPDSLECRGITYRLTDRAGVELDVPQLVCRPMKKFFNLNENPFTMNLDLSAKNIDKIELKADGSLISTYLDVDGQVALKSKGSLHSEQAQAAMKILNNTPSLLADITTLVQGGWTVNMELVAPYNRIVLNYQQERLIVLNIRHNVTGALMDINDPAFAQLYPSIKAHAVENACDLFDMPYADLIAKAKDLTDIEGFIVYLKDGTVFKLKTEWYLVLHRSRDNVDTPRRLFEAAVLEATDDLRSLFFDNPYVLNKIEEMEKFASGIYNHVVDSVERFVNAHRDLIDADNRKQFALNAQAQLEPHLMGLAMTNYDYLCGKRSKPADYKEYVIKHWKRWGVKDEKVQEE